MGTPHSSSGLKAKWLLSLFALLLVACQPKPTPLPTPTKTPTPVTSATPVGPLTLEQKLASEAVLGELNAELRWLARSLANLTVSDPRFKNQFAEQVTWNVVSPAPEGEGWREHQVQEAQQTGREGVQIWTTLLTSVESFEWVDVAIVSGGFVSPGTARWRGQVAVSALARESSGRALGLKAELEITWSKQEQGWRITHLVTRQLKTASAPEKVFRDVTSAVVSNPLTLASLRDSVGFRVIQEYLEDPESEEKRRRVVNPHSDLAMGFHPGLAVVDINADGFDDIYVCRRYETNSMLVNQGDGRFLDRASELGLDVKGDSTCAVFADFDNDGDPDLFLGRYFSPSRYFENRDGKFLDKTQTRLGSAPDGVTCASVADFDNDGLLDLFAGVFVPFAEGFPERLTYNFFSKEPDDPEIARELSRASVFPFSRKPSEKLLQLMQSPSNHMLASRYSTPSVLYRNRGASFQEMEPPLVLSSNSMHGGFADLDGDGDVDLVSANPNGPNFFLRNDKGRFALDKELSLTMFLRSAMGVAFADYDNDLDLDLYFSIMYSKANKRIANEIQQRQFTPGNVLFANNSGAFSQVSGPDGLAVHKAGWSWGSQFFDYDNDGYLDIYALAGFYTAPVQHALPVDQ